MALLIDESMPTVAELLNCDSSLVDVAGAEGIDLHGKIAIARAEVITQLQIYLMEEGESPSAVDSVVVTEPLKRWIVLAAIGLSYRDGHFRHLSDRYKEKWLLYERLADAARSDLKQMGVGRAARPIRRPVIGTIATTSGSLAEGSYVLSVAAVGADGSESEASESVAHYLDALSGIQVDAPALPDTASGWNVYAGRTQEQLQKQNMTPLHRGVPFRLTALQALGKPGNGQQPALFTREIRCIRRG